MFSPPDVEHLALHFPANRVDEAPVTSDPEKERQDKAQRQVSALHSEAKRLARLMPTGRTEACG